jgi:hypothetical protein
MRNKHLLAVASTVFAGCSNLIQSDGVWMTREQYANQRLEPEFAQLLSLYQSGAIDAETLASRRNALQERAVRERQERLRREEDIQRNTES